MLRDMIYLIRPQPVVLAVTRCRLWWAVPTLLTAHAPRIPLCSTRAYMT